METYSGWEDVQGHAPGEGRWLFEPTLPPSPGQLSYLLMKARAPGAPGPPPLPTTSQLGEVFGKPES